MAKHILLISMMCSELALAGGWGSSGGGSLRQSDEWNPWFLGDEPIPYCLLVADNFPIPRDELSQLVKDSFGKWKTFFQENHLYQQPFPGKFLDGKARSPAVEAVEIPTCHDPKHQLQFKFGTMDAETQFFFQHNAKTYVGFSQRQAYDHETFRSGGYIWLAPQHFDQVETIYRGLTIPFPDWLKVQDSLAAVLLHEIGHVLGMQHDSTYIMASSLYDSLVEANSHLYESPSAPETHPAYPRVYLDANIELGAYNPLVKGFTVDTWQDKDPRTLLFETFPSFFNAHGISRGFFMRLIASEPPLDDLSLTLDFFTIMKSQKVPCLLKKVTYNKNTFRHREDTANQLIKFFSHKYKSQASLSSWPAYMGARVLGAFAGSCRIGELDVPVHLSYEPEGLMFDMTIGNKSVTLLDYTINGSGLIFQTTPF